MERPISADECASGSSLYGPCKLQMLSQAMGIQRYIFFSIHNAEKHPEVPLMQVKTCTERYIQQSSLNYTIFRLCGFMQAWSPQPDEEEFHALIILPCTSAPLLQQH